jgi:hypothetical protein
MRTMLVADEAQTSRFPNRLFVRTPAGLSAAIEAAARMHFMTASEYTRRCLLSAIKKDGIRLGLDGTVDTGVAHRR